MKQFIFFMLTGLLSVQYAAAQYPLTGSYNQDFNTLAVAGSAPAVTLPAGWLFVESGSSADSTYSAGTGSSATGDTWSFGSAGDTDRALGSLRSGTLTTQLAFYFTNQTGQLITSLTAAFTAEQWRLGATGRSDRLAAHFSLNATTPATGDWAAIPGLDLFSPVTTGTTGALNGNLPTNRVTVSYTITGIQLPAGSTCILRWTDMDAAGADDGLGIDAFSLHPGFTLPGAFQYRTKQSGDWSALQCWEMSADGINWTAAGTLPDEQATSIRISSGDTITYNYNSSLAGLSVAPGALLIYAGGQLTIADGPGDDLVIDSAGIFQLTLASRPPILAGAATIRIKGNAVLRISAGGLTTVAGAGVHAAGYLYQHGAILENAYNGFAAAGITYFPAVTDDTIPVLRITQPVTLPAGSSSVTRVNGLLEVNASVTFTGTGKKYFRNGITGNGQLSTTTSSGALVIDGRQAVLGGAVTIQLSHPAGIETGGAGGTRMLLLADKTIHGNLTLNAGVQRIETGNYNLRVTGTINGAGEQAYICTNGTGALTLDQVDETGRLFPVGHSRYNPVFVAAAGGLSWSAGVKDSVTADPAFTTGGAVLLTWRVLPAGIPVSPAAIRVEFADSVQTGNLFNDPVYISAAIQPWRRYSGFWLAAGTPVPVVPVSNSRKSITVSGLTQFGDFAFSRTALPLPLRLQTFSATPAGDQHCRLYWHSTDPLLLQAVFHVEVSGDGRRFYTVQEAGNLHAVTSGILIPSSRPGRHFYRLRIEHSSGFVAYSTIQSCEHTAGQYSIRVFPVPARGAVQLELPAGATGTAPWLITDLAGKQVRAGQFAVQGTTGSVTVPVDGLAGGYYLLTCTINGKTYSARFLKTD